MLERVVADDLLSIDEVSVGDWAGQLLACSDGYELAERPGKRPGRKSQTELWLMPAGDIALGKLVMRGKKPRVLHRQFARLSRDRAAREPNSILTFAGKWGLLEDSSPDPTRQTAFPHQSLDKMAIVLGERLADWYLRADHVAAWVKWWDVLNNDGQHLAHHFMWDRESGSLRYFFSFDGRSLSTNQADPKRRFQTRLLPGNGDSTRHVWPPLVDGQLARGERIFKLHPKLREQCFDPGEAGRFLLYQEIERQLEGNIRVGLTMNRESQRAMITYPTGLWGAIWLHFAHEVMGRGAQLQRCANPRCNDAFLPRSNKKYCSPVCRAGHFQRSKQRQSNRDPR